MFLQQNSLTPLHVYGKEKGLGDGANEESSLAVGKNEISWTSNMKRSKKAKNKQRWKDIVIIVLS